MYVQLKMTWIVTRIFRRKCVFRQFSTLFNLMKTDSNILFGSSIYSIFLIYIMYISQCNNFIWCFFFIRHRRVGLYCWSTYAEYKGLWLRTHGCRSWSIQVCIHAIKSNKNDWCLALFYSTKYIFIYPFHFN